MIAVEGARRVGWGIRREWQWREKGRNLTQFQETARGDDSVARALCESRKLCHFIIETSVCLMRARSRDQFGLPPVFESPASALERPTARFRTSTRQAQAPQEHARH
jgi:hypothetical protein